ncbi:MAG TPA: efflux RND transporter periplasmic adaptor subunit [Thermoanaerobaculia bacterium]|nr:efflux RND transporter periplasmic adaptor subunit [Thermoanaerobaculia bacterium]
MKTNVRIVAPPLRKGTSQMIQDTSSMDRQVVVARTPRTMILIAVAGAAVLILAALLFPSIRRWARAEKAVDATSLRFGVVSRGDLLRDVSVQGRVVASLHPTLFSAGQGIVSLRTKAGSQVRQGDVLATIDSKELQSALEQARAQLLSIRAELDRQKIVARQSQLRARQSVDLLGLRLEAAKRNLVRNETTFREGLSNKADYESAQDGVRIAQMELEQARKELDLSRETLSFEIQTREQQVISQQSVAADLTKRVDELTIRAPFDGMVASVAVQDRDAVAPNQAVLTVVNLSSLELEIALPEEYAGETAIGTPATIAFNGREYQGKVTAVSPEVVANQVAATVAFTEQPEGLKQNQRLTTRLVFESKKDVLKVARGAFVDTTGGRSAFVVDGKMATRRAISLGVTSASEVEVLSGLSVGDTIVVSDTSAFGDATTVLLR